MSATITHPLTLPWEVVFDSVGHNPDIEINAVGWGFVAKIGGGPLDTRIALANSIAATPDLLASTKELVNALRDREWGTPAHAEAERKALAAIAKAERR